MNSDKEEPRKTRIILGFIVFFVLFSMAPTFYEWNARGRIRPERFFELVHNFPTDYRLYLSRIRQGKEGAWLATEKYTSEPHAGSLSQVMYMAIGRLAHFSHVQTPYVWFAYHVGRIFFGVFLLWITWRVTAWVYNEAGFLWQSIAFLLIATQSTWPKFEFVRSVPRLGGWMPWYTMADSLQRTTFMPHVLLAQGLIIFILWVFSGGFVTKNTPGNFVFLGIIGLVLGIIFPPGLLFIYGVLGIVTLGEFLWLWRSGGWSMLRTWFMRDLFGRIVFGVVTAPSFIYFALLLSQYPWKRLAEFDVLHPTAFSFVEYFMAMGPLLPLGLLSIVFIAARRKFEVFGRLRFFIAWIVMWLVFLFVFDKIPQQSPTRFTQMVPHVPLGILTAYMFYELFILARRVKIKIWRYVCLIVPMVIILFGIATMASSYMWLKDFVDHKLRATIPLVPRGAEVMYPLYDIVDGLVWLQVNTPRSTIVLSGAATGNYIPLYSGNTAFVGHANTVELENKTAAMENFYRLHLTLDEELAWLASQHISYILYGPEEVEIAGGVEDLKVRYPTLVQVFQNKTVRIYKAP